MPEFDRYVARHGEFWVQGIIEDIERKEGLRGTDGLSLEQRWAFLMGQAPTHQQRIAA